MVGRTLRCCVLALLLAGCSGAPDAPTDDAPPADDGMAEAPTQWAFAGDGTLALGNCWDGPLGDSCVLNVGDPTAQRLAGNILHFPIEGANGTATAMATLTWQASSPLTEELELRFSLLDCGDGSCSTAQVLQTVTGASPLVLDLAATEIPMGQALGVTVARAELAAGNRASLLQDVRVEGTAIAAGTTTLKPSEAQGNSTL